MSKTIKKIICFFIFVTFVSTSVNSKPLTVLEIIGNNKDLSLFYSHIKDNGLDKLLNKKMPWDWTIFAPNNEAFKKFEMVENSFLKDKFLLKNLLMDHILAGRASSQNIGDQAITDKTVSNKPLQLYKANELFVKDMIVLKEDLSASNGVVHSIGCVMFVQPSKDDKRVDKEMQKKYPITSCCMQRTDEINLWKSSITLR